MSTDLIQALDPMPWRHISGGRVSDPNAPGSPAGGYTFDPRHGYSDHPNRYISKRHPRPCGQCQVGQVAA